MPSASTTCRAAPATSYRRRTPGLAVAIADKLDTLAGIFEIGEKPTGAKDPFGLRRAAIGLLRILIEKRLDLDLRKLIGVALGNVRADVERIRAAKAARPRAGVAAPPALDGRRTRRLAAAPAARGSTRTHPAEDQVYDFIMERLRAYYLEAAPDRRGQRPASRRVHH